eukprot:6908738-Prymnesium_polylepis.1
MPGHRTLESLCKEAAVVPGQPQPWGTHFAGFALRAPKRGPLACAEQIIQHAVSANASAFPPRGSKQLSKSRSAFGVAAAVRSSTNKLLPSSIKHEARKLARQSSNLVGIGHASHKVCLLSDDLEDEEEQGPVPATPALLVRFDHIMDTVTSITGEQDDMKLSILISTRSGEEPVGQTSSSGMGQEPTAQDGKRLHKGTSTPSREGSTAPPSREAGSVEVWTRTRTDTPPSREAGPASRPSSRGDDASWVRTKTTVPPSR